ncbi:MAG: hypothetical protein O7A04_12315, partial [Acidobacteria bacterium]|nr:hypothetical protein [Acidobacteriota bacterium]
MITELLIETQAEANDTQLVLELSGSARFDGEIPEGLVLVLAGTSYTVQAAVKVDKGAKTITPTVSPVVDAQALVGAAVTVPAAASSVGTDSAAPRFMEDVVSSNSAFASRVEVGSKIYGIEKGSLTIELEAGDRGDYIDVSGISMGRVAQVLDS